MDGLHEVAKLAGSLLGRAPTPDAEFAHLLRLLSRGENLSDDDIEKLQTWALIEFIGNLDSDFEPNSLALVADELIGRLEQMKSTWE
ncbi:MAG: hypothetical protein HRF45_06080 [Fimbriimonadia bacterium]